MDFSQWSLACPHRDSSRYSAIHYAVRYLSSKNTYFMINNKDYLLQPTPNCQYYNLSYLRFSPHPRDCYHLD